MSKKTHIGVIYHRGCRDGFAAAAVADRYYSEKGGSTLHYFGLDPNKLMDGLITVVETLHGLDIDSSNVVIRSFDVGFSKEGLEFLKKHYEDVLIVDHHKTTVDNFGGLDNLPKEVVFDNDHCGCVLAWKHYYGEACKVPDFLLYLQDRDLWREDMPHTNSVNEGLYALISFSYGESGGIGQPDFSEWIAFMDDREIWYNRARELGSILLQNKARDLSRTKSGARKVQLVLDGKGDLDCSDDNIGKYTVMVCNTNCLISDLGNLLVKENPDVDFAFLYRIVGDEVWVSLRSLEKFDTTVVSKAYGGGGHRCASGFTFPFSRLSITPDVLTILST